MTDHSHPIYRMSKEEILSALLKKQHGYYQAVLEITEKEALQLQGKGSVAELTPLMKQKKILMQCIQEIDLALSPLKKHWKEKSDRSSPIDEEVKVELAKLNTVIKEILRVDEENQRRFQQKLLELKDRAKVKSPEA